MPNKHPAGQQHYSKQSLTALQFGAWSALTCCALHNFVYPALQNFSASQQQPTFVASCALSSRAAQTAALRAAAEWRPA